MIAALEDMRWLQAFATWLAQDEDAADDLVQDTMVAAWRQPPPDEQRGVRPWLASVLRNRLRMRARVPEPSVGARRGRPGRWTELVVGWKKRP
jgi:DNA-directed RNA polymerase specialized sigma24 family protein